MADPNIHSIPARSSRCTSVQTCSNSQAAVAFPSELAAAILLARCCLASCSHVQRYCISSPEVRQTGAATASGYSRNVRSCRSNSCCCCCSPAAASSQLQVLHQLTTHLHHANALQCGTQLRCQQLLRALLLLPLTYIWCCSGRLQVGRSCLLQQHLLQPCSTCSTATNPPAEAINACRAPTAGLMRAAAAAAASHTRSCRQPISCCTSSAADVTSTTPALLVAANASYVLLLLLLLRCALPRAAPR